MPTNAPSQITGVSIIYFTVCSGEDQRKHQNSASLAFLRGIHRWPVNSPHKGPETRKMFPFDDIIMIPHRLQKSTLILLYGRCTWVELLHPVFLIVVQPTVSRRWGVLCANPPSDKQRVLMHGHQGWNVRHDLCHIYMRYVCIYELFIAFVSFVVCSLL